MPAPTTLQALAMGARATRRSAWLVAPALGVAFLRSALSWPALAAAAAFLVGGARARLGAGVASPVAAAQGALDALLAPRSLAVIAGLWLAGALLAGALRVAWLAGALPTLGAELGTGDDRRPRFAEGFAFGFSPLLGTGVLVAAIEAMAQLYALTVYLGLALLLARGGGSHPVLAAVVGALAATGAVAGPVLAWLVGDAALARTALSGDPATGALAEGARRVLRRPAAFLLAALALGVAAAALLGTVETLETATLGVASGAPALLAVGPRLMLTVLAAAVAALLELWRLGTVAALACAGEP